MQKKDKRHATMDSVLRRQTSMKNLLLILTVFVSVTVAQGQTSVYHPFPTSKSLWSDVFIDQYNNILARNQYGIFGDTVIGSYTYHKLYKRTLPCLDTSMTTSNSSLTGAIMEDSLKRVYYYSFYPFNNSYCIKNKNYKIYDFSKQIVGDTILFDTTSFPNVCYGYPYLTIKKIDSILIKGSYRKQYNFFEQGETWVEGMGSLRGLLSAFIIPVTCSCVNALVCNLQNDSMYYYSSTYNYCICGYPLNTNNIEKENKFSISPNPFSIQTTLQADNFFQNASVTVYNSFGQTVKQIDNLSGQTIIFHRDNLPSGLYFIRITQDGNTISADKFVITDK